MKKSFFLVGQLDSWQLDSWQLAEKLIWKFGNEVIWK
jgi:hypothetical protein